MKWILCGDLDTLRRWWSKMEKCKQTRKHKYTFVCNYSMKHQEFYRLVSFAQNTDIHMSGTTVKVHDWPKNGKTITCTVDNFVPLVVPGLSSSSSSSSASTYRPNDQSNSSRLEVTSVRETDADRSRQASLGKPWTSTQRKTRWTRRIQRKAFPIGYSPSQII